MSQHWRSGRVSALRREGYMFDPGSGRTKDYKIAPLAPCLALSIWGVNWGGAEITQGFLHTAPPLLPTAPSWDDGSNAKDQQQSLELNSDRALIDFFPQHLKKKQKTKNWKKGSFDYLDNWQLMI